MARDRHCSAHRDHRAIRLRRGRRLGRRREGVVNATGAHTTVAGIAALTRQAHRPPSPLTVQLNRVVKIIAVIAIIAGALLGMAGLGMGLAPTQAFLFAVGVAVALVPEGL